MRKIIHIDMDCFFAAIECRDDPAIASKPVGVGGSSSRSVLTTCNYEARRFGCRSAMPVFKARELCPHLIIKPSRFDIYRRDSRRIRDIFQRYTELIEPLSLDEAYLDVSHQKQYAWDIAKKIRNEILEETGLTASAGISYNKMLAKIASDWRKPNGQFAVTPDTVDEFLIDLPLRRIYGVGPKSAEKLRQQGFETCGQLQKLSQTELIQIFKSAWGHELFKLCRGEDERPVESRQQRKSMSTETTFSEDIETADACIQELDPLLQDLQTDLAKHRDLPPIHKLFIKLKFSDFQSTTRECLGNTLERATFTRLLREAFERSPKAVRLLGIGVRFVDPDKSNYRQLELGIF